MCLYPTLINNPKYRKTKKNGGIIPPISDIRVTKVPIGCQRCIECKKQKANTWRIRLLEDIRHNTNAHFVTLTFNTESLKKLTHKINNTKHKLEGYDLDNAIAAKAVRLYTDKHRKANGKSIRHFLITELGDERNEHLHLHGILWTDKPEQIKEMWDFGYIYRGEFVNEQTINYIIKYIIKIDKTHPNYNQIILTSPGIGKRYLERTDAKNNTFKEEQTFDKYRTRQGHRYNLPIYYRNKLYTEEQREQLWLHKLNKQERYVLGIKIDISETEEQYEQALKYAQQLNKEIGYGEPPQSWEAVEYERQRRILKQKQRLENKNDIDTDVPPKKVHKKNKTNQHNLKE